LRRVAFADLTRENFFEIARVLFVLSTFTKLLGNSIKSHDI